MATLTINIPDSIEVRLISGASKALGYNGSDTPAGRKQFVKTQAIVWLKTLAVQGETIAAVEALKTDKTISDAAIN